MYTHIYRCWRVLIRFLFGLRVKYFTPSHSNTAQRQQLPNLTLLRLVVSWGRACFLCVRLVPPRYLFIVFTCKDILPCTYGKMSVHVRKNFLTRRDVSHLTGKQQLLRRKKLVFTDVFSPRQYSRLILRFGAARPAERKRSLDISHDIVLSGEKHWTFF